MIVYKYTFDYNKFIVNYDENTDELINEAKTYDGMIYIGSTKNEADRHKAHRMSKAHDKFHKVTRKFGLDKAFTKEILWKDKYATVEEMRIKEQEFIDKFNPFDENGFNTMRRTVLNHNEINNLLNNRTTAVVLVRRDGLIYKIYKSITDVIRHESIDRKSIENHIIEVLPTVGRMIKNEFYAIKMTTLGKIIENIEIGIRFDVDNYIKPATKHRIIPTRIVITTKLDIIVAIVSDRVETSKLLSVSLTALGDLIDKNKMFKGLYVKEIPLDEMIDLRVGYPIDYKKSSTTMYYVYKNKLLVNVCFGLETVKTFTKLHKNKITHMIQYKEEYDDWFIETVESDKTKIIGLSKVGVQSKKIQKGVIMYYD